jgi:hypothetical protein
MKCTVFGSGNPETSSVIVWSDRNSKPNCYRYEAKFTSSNIAKDMHDYQKNWKRTSVNNGKKTSKFITEFYNTDSIQVVIPERHGKSNP